MTEMIFQSGQSLPLGDAGQSELVRRIRDLREELNWYYHRIELEQLRPEETSAQRLQQLQEKALSHENEFLRTLRELPAHERENATLEAPADFSLEKLQSAIPADCRSNRILFNRRSFGRRRRHPKLHRNHSHHRILPRLPFPPPSPIPALQIPHGRHLHATLRATAPPSHPKPLESLYAELIAPLRQHLQAKHLIFVPHGPLHFLPFHALKNGDTYLCDTHTVSYAPSATVFALCQEKPPSEMSASLVMGIPDERAPQILDEVQSVAAILPNSDLLLGDQATTEVLKKKGSQSALLHIATHGTYRQDNPMFSGIRLGDGYLNLYDLYQMRLSARHVTLSGCATGMNFVAAGDELLGLQRGLFCAGAASLLLSLWDVHDRSTAELMQSFYKGYMEIRRYGAFPPIRHEAAPPAKSPPLFLGPFRPRRSTRSK